MTPAPTTATERGSVGPVEDIVVDDQPVAQRLAPGRAAHAGREPVAMTMRSACAPACGRPPAACGRRRSGRGPAAGARRASARTASTTKPTKRSRSLRTRAITARPSIAHAAGRARRSARRRPTRMRRVGRRDQQLAGHAAHAGAGGAVDAALDHQHARRVRQRRAVGRHAGGAGADDGDVGLDDGVLVHGRCLRVQRPSSLRPGWSSGRRPCGQWNLRSLRGDRHVVDAGEAPVHQAVVVELPVLVAVGAEPVAGVVAPFVGEAHGDAVAVVAPTVP